MVIDMVKTLPVFRFPGGSTPTLAEVGGKGLSLIKGSEAGLPVPPGFVLPVVFFKPWLEQLKLTPQWQTFTTAGAEQMQPACNALKQVSAVFRFTVEQQETISQALQSFDEKALFAVRSSSPEEDLEGASFAGGYETILGVNKSGIEAAVLKAFISCLDFRVAAYKREHGFDASSPKIAVVVQNQIASDVAGVGFSINPLTNNFDEEVFNANFGLGETVVGGLATPDTIRVNKISRTIVEKTVGGKETSIWLEPNGGTSEKAASAEERDKLCLNDEQILVMADQIAAVEKLYGKPMDTEWAFADNQFYLLQARPITAFVPVSPTLATAAGEKKFLYIDVTIVVQGLYKPISAMGTSVLRLLVKTAGSQLFGLNLLGDPHKSVVIAENGRLYLNVSHLLGMFGHEKVSKMLANMDPNSSRALAETDASQYTAPHEGHLHPPLQLLAQLPEIALHLVEARLLPEHAHKNAQKEIARYRSEVREMAGDPMPVWELADQLISKIFKFIRHTTIPLFVGSRLALEHMKGIAIAGGASEELLGRLERALPNNVTTEMGLALYHLAMLEPEGSTFKEEWQRFIDLYGHRGPIELDIASPRYRDQPQMLIDQIASLRPTAQSEDNPQARFDKAQVERHEAYETICEAVQKKEGWLQLKRFQSLYKVYETLGGYRELHKYLLIFAIDQLRARLIMEGDKLVSQGRIDKTTDIFNLTLDDLKKASVDDKLDLRSLASTNTAFAAKLGAVPTLPSLFDSRGCILRPTPPAPREGEVVGTAISPGVVRGRIKVLHSPDEKPLLRGEILVARATDPGWTPLFVNAAAVILEIGGMLQHGALVAREYGLPCVSGVSNATTLFQDGTLVEVDGSVGIIRILES